MDIALEKVVQAYFEDTDYQKSRAARKERRNASLDNLRRLTWNFINARTNLDTFRKDLDKLLRSEEDWGARGPGFMMEIHKLALYHLPSDKSVEEYFRNILRGVNHSNLGQRIEKFYQFLLSERERLRKEGKQSTTIVSARNSAFMISLFAFWLDSSQQNIIYYDSLRKGLYVLVDSKILPEPENLQKGTDAIEVRSEIEHKACLQLVNNLEQSAPSLVKSIYWLENFCLWVKDHFQALTSPSTILNKETGETALLASQADILTAPSVKEAPAEYALALTEKTGQDGDSVLIPPDPLKPTPEPLLTALIQEVQRRILVDESTIRRIYLALLAGHVILTGPPGTGKTELARLIPEILWQSRANSDGRSENTQEREASTTWESRTAYTTRLVTAHSEWSVRTLIGGIAPQNKNGTLTYTIQYGHLTTAILKNWSFNSERPDEWNALRRTTGRAPSGIEHGIQKVFRGQWLVIDEFNRAPIDIALGEALTALSSSGHEVLRVPIEAGTAELPIPQDFRIIGTLNSFDRTFLNQISEALKRRFAFIEILPLTRAQSEAEQAIILYKALLGLRHLDEEAIESSEDGLGWHNGGVSIGLQDNGRYIIDWETGDHPFRTAFEAAWCIFEVLRIYRQMGTAQALSFMRQVLIAGLVQKYTTSEQWMEAVDIALCDTLADQLQVLLPDEINVLWLYLTAEPTQFPTVCNNLLAGLSPQRIHAQLLKLGSITRQDGQPGISDQEIDMILAQDIPTIPEEWLKEVFHLAQPIPALPQFARRLRTFKVERGL